MLIIPAVDIKGGKCVQLVQGKPGTEHIILENPVEVAREWERRGASILHVVDLDGAFGDRSKNIKIIKKIIKELSIPIQLGGGIRSKKGASKLLNMGIDRIILGTMAIENPENVKELADEFGSERIIVALDIKDSEVVIKGWTEKTMQSAPKLAKLFEKKGAGGILFTNVDLEGLMEGIDIKPVLELLDAVNIPIVYSGGVTSIEDIKKLYKIGVYGVVIGSALYKNKIKFEEALTFLKNAQ